VDDSETNPRKSIEFLPLRTKPFAGQTERILKQPTATIVAKPRDMHYCRWHDITRHHLVPRCTWRENIAMTVVIQQSLNEIPYCQNIRDVIPPFQTWIPSNGSRESPLVR